MIEEMLRVLEQLDSINVKLRFSYMWQGKCYLVVQNFHAIQVNIFFVGVQDGSHLRTCEFSPGKLRNYFYLKLGFLVELLNGRVREFSSWDVTVICHDLVDVIVQINGLQDEHVG